jgi:hypothetical protein
LNLIFLCRAFIFVFYWKAVALPLRLFNVFCSYLRNNAVFYCENLPIFYTSKWGNRIYLLLNDRKSFSFFIIFNKGYLLVLLMFSDIIIKRLKIFKKYD